MRHWYLVNIEREKDSKIQAPTCSGFFCVYMGKGGENVRMRENEGKRIVERPDSVICFMSCSTAHVESKMSNHNRNTTNFDIGFGWGKIGAWLVHESGAGINQRTNENRKVLFNVRYGATYYQNARSHSHETP